MGAHGGTSGGTPRRAEQPSRLRVPRGTADVTTRFDELACRAVDLLGAGETAANWVAERQHGLITADQARRCGLGRKAIGGRCRRRTWKSVRRRVYLVGAQEPSDDARALAAVLGCAPGAVASYTTAGWLWGLIPRLPNVIDLTLLDGRNPGDPAGIRVHRFTTHGPTAIRWRRGIPLTCPSDTLLELAGLLKPDELEAACALAFASRLTTPARLGAAVAESPPRAGIATLRALAEPALTRSRNERAMVALVRRAGLPPPETNVVVCGKQVDLYWPDARLAVEVDDFFTHGGSSAFEDDRRLDADFLAAGIELLRFTGRRIRGDSHAVVARLAVVLAARMEGLPVRRR